MKEKKKGIGRKVTIFAVKRIKLLYIIEIVYIYALYMIIKPVFFKVLTGLLHLHGYSYLTNEMMLSFFGNFDVIVILLLMFFTTGILGSILYGYMYEYISMRMTDTMINHRTLLKRTKKIMTKCLKQHPAKMIFLVVGSLLFRNILAIMIAGRYVPNVWYILKNILNFSYMRYVVIIATFGIIVYFFRNFFLMEGMFIYGDSNKIAKETGKILWKNKRKESITLWIFGNIVTVVFIIVFYFVLVGITIGIIVLFIPKALRIAVFCTIQEHLYKITFLLSILIGTTLQMVGSTYLFLEESGKCFKEYEDIEQKEKNFWRRKKIYLLVVAILCLDIFMTGDLIRNGGNITFEHFGQVTITAHRGASMDAPENTYLAVEKAIETTTDYIEIDVQETKDGVVVLMHDNSLQRTTGAKNSVYNLTYEEVQKLDAGSWFSAEYKGTKVPTLREILELCKGKTKLNIEIKANKKTPDLEKKVVELIEEFDFTRQCVVTSVYKQSLKNIKKYNKEIQTGYIVSSAYGRYYLDEEIDFLSMRSTMINERVVRLAHKNGKEVYVWTVNTQKEAIRMCQLGVDNIITDCPTYIRQILYENEKNQTFIALLKLMMR